jgi:hypothetical protein
MFWNFGTDFVGFIWLGFGFSVVFALMGDILKKRRINVSLSLMVLEEFQRNPMSTTEEIAKATGISLKNVEYIVMKLKMRRYLPNNISLDELNINSMQDVAIMTGSSGTSRHSISQTKEMTYPPSQLPKYCPNCSAKVDQGTIQYCSYCGYAFF